MSAGEVCDWIVELVPGYTGGRRGGGDEPVAKIKKVRERE